MHEDPQKNDHSTSVWRRRINIDDHLRVVLAIWCVIQLPVLLLISWRFRPAIWFVPISLSWGIIHWRDIRRGVMHRRWRREGRCLHCGYNLTGNVSGVCPECGTDVEAAGTDQAQASRSSRTERSI